MNSRSLLIALTLIGLALVAWHLRWVLLILFGAVVVAVALGPACVDSEGGDALRLFGAAHGDAAEYGEAPKQGGAPLRSPV